MARNPTSHANLYIVKARSAEPDRPTGPKPTCPGWPVAAELGLAGLRQRFPTPNRPPGPLGTYPRLLSKAG